MFALRLPCLYRSLNLACESSELLTRGGCARRLRRCTCLPAAPPARSPRRGVVLQNFPSFTLTETPRYAVVTRGITPALDGALELV